MMPSNDPGLFYALIEHRGELRVEPLLANWTGRGQVLRISQSKSALKNWRRVYEFKTNAANGRKEVTHGNCNS